MEDGKHGLKHFRCIVYKYNDLNENSIHNSILIDESILVDLNYSCICTSMHVGVIFQYLVKMLLGKLLNFNLSKLLHLTKFDTFSTAMT